MAALATTADAPTCHFRGGYCGCYGGCWGGCYGCYGCYGCWGGGYGWYGGCYGCYGGVKVVANQAAPKQVAATSTTRAKLVVELPEDAKLYIDDQLMKTASGKRTFSTPTLDRAQAYYYMVRAEVVRDGKTYSETKRVIVRAAETAQALFPEEQLVQAENEVKTVASAR